MIPGLLNMCFTSKCMSFFKIKEQFELNSKHMPLNPRKDHLTILRNSHHWLQMTVASFYQYVDNCCFDCSEQSLISIFMVSPSSPSYLQSCPISQKHTNKKKSTCMQNIIASITTVKRLLFNSLRETTSHTHSLNFWFLETKLTFHPA